MRILMLLTDAFGGRGGIAKFNRDFLRALASHPRCDEVVAVPRLMPDPAEKIPRKISFVASGLNSKAKFTLAVLKSVVRNRRFDFVVCGHLNLLPLAVLAKKISGAPIVQILHGIEAWQPTRRAITNSLVGRLDAAISVSEVTRARFSKWSRWDGEPAFVLPNAVDLGEFTPGEKSRCLLERYKLSGRTVLMTLARLHAAERYKGIDEVLEILPALARKIPDVSYLIVGDGSGRARLEEKAARLGLKERVVFAGAIHGAERAAHYRLADAFVMPGSGEGFGIVYLEAMACGVPVVGSIADGSREALRNGHLGVLVDPQNPKSIREGILEALRRRRGVPRGLEYFSTESFERRCHKIFDDLLKKFHEQTKS